MTSLTYSYLSEQKSLLCRWRALVQDYYDYVELQEDINKIYLLSQITIQHIQMQMMLISKKQICACLTLSPNNQPMEFVESYNTWV